MYSVSIFFLREEDAAKFEGAMIELMYLDESRINRVERTVPGVVDVFVEAGMIWYHDIKTWLCYSKLSLEAITEFNVYRYI